MVMSQLGTVEDTLFVPMLGRIYASHEYPQILSDRKAMELEGKLPESVKEADRQKQYTLIASASRSANMDRIIKEFLGKHPDGVIVELGCGLETTWFRNTSQYKGWFALDLPNVIDYRKSLLGEDTDIRYISADAFDATWMAQIRKDFPKEPVLITASGLFYYFEEEKVLKLFRSLQEYGSVEVVFDTVNSSGMKRMRSTYMKQVGHADAAMFFYVDDAKELVKKIGRRASVIAEEAYYRYIPKKGLEFSTSLTMRLSDLLMMVKMEHLKLS